MDNYHVRFNGLVEEASGEQYTWQVGDSGTAAATGEQLLYQWPLDYASDPSNPYGPSSLADAGDRVVGSSDAPCTPAYGPSSLADAGDQAAGEFIGYVSETAVDGAEIAAAAGGTLVEGFAALANIFFGNTGA